MSIFNNNATWYLTSNLQAYKLASDHIEFIHEFNYECFKNNCIILSDTLTDVTTFAESCIKEYNTNTIIGLFDSHKNRCVAILMIRRDNEAKVLIHITAMEEHISRSDIFDILSWVIDYVFYQLHYKEIIFLIPEIDQGLINACHKFEIKMASTPDKTNNYLPRSGCLYQTLTLVESDWLNADNSASYNMPIDTKIADQYLEGFVLPYFSNYIETEIYTTLISYRYEIICASQKSAQSVGMENWHQMTGTGYKYYSEIDLGRLHFGEQYNSKSAHAIHRYARKIFRIQQYVFKMGTVASFIDSLPYDKGINSYQVTFIPIFDRSNNIIAIQTIATDYHLASYQKYIQHITMQKRTKSANLDLKLTTREEEILFLLICGITQEQIAQILNIKRATVAAVIRNQLCIKFNLSECKTKSIIEYAQARGLPTSVPQSLWRPSVIISEDKIARWVDTKHKLSGYL